MIQFNGVRRKLPRGGKNEKTRATIKNRKTFANLMQMFMFPLVRDFQKKSTQSRRKFFSIFGDRYKKNKRNIDAVQDIYRVTKIFRGPTG